MWMQLLVRANMYKNHIPLQLSNGNCPWFNRLIASFVIFNNFGEHLVAGIVIPTIIHVFIHIKSYHTISPYSKYPCLEQWHAMGRQKRSIPVTSSLDVFETLERGKERIFEIISHRRRYRCQYELYVLFKEPPLNVTGVGAESRNSPPESRHMLNGAAGNAYAGKHPSSPIPPVSGMRPRPPACQTSHK